MLDISFANPELLLLLLIIPGLAVWYYYRLQSKESDIRYSTLSPFSSIKQSMKERFRHLPFVLRMIVVALIIVALARPQSTSKGQNVHSEGIDIVLAIDISGSMLAEDFQPNRIEAAKNVAQEFITGRTNDRIGLVIFSGESFTQCPLTVDYDVLKSLIRPLKSGMIEDGTAIGLGLGNAINRLRESKAKSKVIILLTDGVNNRGEIDPITAAQIAQSYDIRVYTVGVGTIGEAPYPIPTPFGTRYQMVPVEIDEKVLKQVAEMTEGKYFRATDNKKLRAIYQEIDQMEKTRVEVRSYRRYTELFYSFIFGAVFLLIVDVGIVSTWLRKIP
ncbi:MAG: VWA domain-containing protein [Ignavibacteriales bacterium]|nr:VWA domain-containing protein [Ignavibacteriales bacterium]